MKVIAMLALGCAALGAVSAAAIEVSEPLQFDLAEIDEALTAEFNAENFPVEEEEAHEIERRGGSWHHGGGGHKPYPKPLPPAPKPPVHKPHYKPHYKPHKPAPPAPAPPAPAPVKCHYNGM